MKKRATKVVNILIVRICQGFNFCKNEANPHKWDSD